MKKLIFLSLFLFAGSMMFAQLQVETIKKYTKVEKVVNAQDDGLSTYKFYLSRSEHRVKLASDPGYADELENMFIQKFNIASLSIAFPPGYVEMVVDSELDENYVLKIIHFLNQLADHIE